MFKLEDHVGLIKYLVVHSDQETFSTNTYIRFLNSLGVRTIDPYFDKYSCSEATIAIANATLRSHEEVK